jgi:hypothetical protein
MLLAIGIWQLANRNIQFDNVTIRQFDNVRIRQYYDLPSHHKEIPGT